MKGRRRARRLALQALYELDQSTHDLEVVLKWRLRDFYGSSISSSMGDGEREIAKWLLETYAANGFDDLDAATAATALGVSAIEVEAVLGRVADLHQQASYCERLVRGVRSNVSELDAVIAEIAPEWPVSQMAPVDRNLLRIALFEIASDSSPVRVAINEAVELARQFSGEGARRMVNGALGAYVSRHERLALVTEVGDDE
jgi:N utilization substance protein B